MKEATLFIINVAQLRLGSLVELLVNKFKIAYG